LSTEPLFFGRNPHAGTDTALDALLREVLPQETPSRRPEVSSSEQSAHSTPASQLKTYVPYKLPIVECEAPRERTSIPPLGKFYWVLCGMLLVVVVELGCTWHTQATPTAAANVAKARPADVTPHNDSPLARAEASIRQESESSLGAIESKSMAVESTTWIPEDEPAIETTGPVFRDAFTDWAPRAVLERLSAPRAELVRLPQ
jgi:hypothetical protein